MRDSIGGITLMSIFIFFFIMVTFFLTGTILYYKGYKINSQIINSLEKFEGYNEFSADDIDRTFKNMGYRQVTNADNNCGTSENPITCLGNNASYDFTISCKVATDQNAFNSGKRMQNKHVVYTVTSYIDIDLPLNFKLKIPISTKSNPIYLFSGYENNGMGCFNS